jgi:hypothetical protein
VLALASAASAAVPRKGTYVGDIKSSPFTMHVSMVVASPTKASAFTYLCGTGRPPTSIFNLAIDKTGHFKFTSNPATGQAWKMAGHFVTPTSAFVSLNSISCGGSKGSTTLRVK